ncbi:hypothetical protein [Xanthobacter flavus]|uniref:hypothetical protein n=1 Tax=Xanthobacter flavus TaxID=281 RepID=UPI00372B92A3
MAARPLIDRAADAWRAEPSALSYLLDNHEALREQAEKAFRHLGIPLLCAPELRQWALDQMGRQIVLAIADRDAAAPTRRKGRPAARLERDALMLAAVMQAGGPGNVSARRAAAKRLGVTEDQIEKAESRRAKHLARLALDFAHFEGPDAVAKAAADTFANVVRSAAEILDEVAPLTRRT